MISNKTILPIIIAISGASGSVYGMRALQFLLANNYRVEFIISESGINVARSELNLELESNPNELKKQVLSYLKLPKSSFELLDIWDYKNLSARVSSGSFITCGMIIIPASMGTIGAIASGTSDNLITRAADVCLKERRKLILVPRELPLNTIHLANLLKLSEAGAIIAPAMPAFYHKPKNINDLVDFVVGKIFDTFGFEHNLYTRWCENTQLPHSAQIQV